jgi:hypothetical protein
MASSGFVVGASGKHFSTQTARFFFRLGSNNGGTLAGCGSPPFFVRRFLKNFVRRFLKNEDSGLP